jgi:hypothetical protein
MLDALSFYPSAKRRDIRMEKVLPQIQQQYFSTPTDP